MKKIISMFVWLVTTGLCWGQNVSRSESYNYSRGVEAVQKEDFNEGLEYLNKELEENPKNGYAYAWLSVIRNHNEEYGRTISALDMALKYIPSKDKQYQVFCYSSKSRVYKALNQYDKALSCINRAIKIQPEEEDLYESRAQLYFEQKLYELADEDYKKIISLDAGNVMGYMGLGRNAKERKDYANAIERFNYVAQLAPDYSSSYSFRAEVYIAQKKYNEAASDVVKALSINKDKKAFYHMQQLADSSLISITTRLKVEANKAPTESYWPYCLGVVYSCAEKYHKAAEADKSAYKLDKNDVIAYQIAKAYDELGAYNEALKYCNEAIQADSSDYDYVLLSSVIKDDMGESSSAIEDLNKYVKMTVDSYFGYYRRGWVRDHSGDTEGAIEDYTISITLEPRYTYAYLNRGVLYNLLGESELAKKDFEQVVARDTLKSETHTPYALYYLGKKKEAVDFMQQLLSKNPDKGLFYEATCLYSIMGDTEQSLAYLTKAFEAGYRRFAHIKRDRDLKNLRSTPGFKALLEKYERIHFNEAAKEETGADAPLVTEVVEIPFSKVGNVYKVPCKINNLPLHFIFDTGASDVSISNVEATFMMKNDYLKSTDVMGRQNYLTADGEICEGTVINLRTVNFAGLHLENVKASVVKNQSAPLLLGQSVLNRLGKIEIDNGKGLLKVTYNRPRSESDVDTINP